MSLAFLHAFVELLELRNIRMDGVTFSPSSPEQAQTPPYKSDLVHLTLTTNRKSSGSCQSSYRKEQIPFDRYQFLPRDGV